MRLLQWLLRAFLFFVLFAFALNNQHEVPLKWFFGYEWRAPMVFIVLAALALGLVLGVLGMLPGWWQHRRRARGAQPPMPAIKPTPSLQDEPITESMPLMHPPRDGL
jgi:uncharacterized integral membrane protein